MAFLQISDRDPAAPGSAILASAEDITGAGDD
jgi:hypothetical protein